MFMSVRSLFSKDSFVSIPYMIEKKIRPTWRTFVSLIRLGFNFFIENMAMRVGFVATAVMAAKLGTNPFAAHQVGMNFLNLGFAFGDGMQVAAVALTGRSLGANAKDKALAYGKICQEIGLFISFVLAIIFFAGGRFLFSLYFSDPETIEMGVLISRYIMVTVLVQISQVVYGGCLRGAGDVRYTLFASLISVTLIRTLVTFVLAGLLNFGLHGIWLGILSDQLSRFLMLGSRFRKGEWVKLRL
jgi:Na+-driven multidrug efflux pump